MLAPGALPTRGLMLGRPGAVTLGAGTFQLRFTPALGTACQPPVPGNVLGAAYPRYCCTDGAGRMEKPRGAVAPHDEPPIRVPNDGALNDGRLMGVPNDGRPMGADPPNLPAPEKPPRPPRLKPPPIGAATRPPPDEPPPDRAKPHMGISASITNAASAVVTARDQGILIIVTSLTSVRLLTVEQPVTTKHLIPALHMYFTSPPRLQCALRIRAWAIRTPPQEGP